MAGAVLGGLSGGLQWYANILSEKEKKKKLELQNNEVTIPQITSN